jgi:hypothetical protein
MAPGSMALILSEDDGFGYGNRAGGRNIAAGLRKNAGQIQVKKNTGQWKFDSNKTKEGPQ